MGLLNFFKKATAASRSSEDDQIKFSTDVRTDANALVEQFKESFNLDFSINSLHVLDSILDGTANYYNTQMDEETKKRTIRKAGSYIFVVAQLHFGGKYEWYEKLNQAVLVTGQPEFAVSLLAFEKVKGRLENGIEDNIPFFFEGYINAVQRKASAMIV